MKDNKGIIARIVEGSFQKTAAGPDVVMLPHGSQTMSTEKAERLEKAGWKRGDAKDFLELDASEAWDHDDVDSD